MTGWRYMRRSLRYASSYIDAAGAEGKSHPFAGGCDAVLTAVVNQDGDILWRLLVWNVQ
jgi:hypothetical protein